jgi:hypothetical protein
MAAVVCTNNASTTIAAAITAAATSISLTAGTGALFPTLGTGQVFYAQLTQGTTTEIVQVTARSTDTVTVVRGQDGTGAAAFAQGSAFNLVVSAAVMNSYQPADGLAYVAETGSRALGTAYTNATGRTLYVAVSTAVSAAGTLTVAVASVNVLVAAAPVANGSVFFVVPPGATYAVTASGTQTLSSWYEM